MSHHEAARERRPRGHVQPATDEQPESRSASRPALGRGESGNGSRLAPEIRRTLEPAFRHDFGNVRIFSDADSAARASDLQAEAYTSGSDVVFGDGAWNPGTPLGLFLLAHELTHVVQNERGGALAGSEMTGLAPAGSPAEREAWSAGARVMRGAPVDVSAVPAGALAAAERGFLERAWGALSEEGLGAIMDPFGAYDRQKSQDVLSSHLTVMPDDFIGPRLPNQVSGEEFRNAARTYSDINLGRGDLTVDPRGLSGADADTYKSGVMGNLATMMETDVGRRGISGLSNNVLRDDAGKARHGIMGMELPFDFLPELHHSTSIQPYYLDANADGNRLNDPTGTANFDMTNAEEMAAPGWNPSDASRTATGARGRGNNTVIGYNPGLSLGPGSPDDVVLYHEMVHAMHETQGTQAPGTTVTAASGIPADVTAGIAEFEHQAAGLGTYAGDPLTENAYRRERRMLGAATPARTRYSGAMP